MASIELRGGGAQPRGMTYRPILSRRHAAPQEPQFWIHRAQQARRIATMLTGDDALLCEQFAMECEAKAGQRPKAAQIAA